MIQSDTLTVDDNVQVFNHLGLTGTTPDCRSPVCLRRECQFHSYGDYLCSVFYTRFSSGCLHNRLTIFII